MDGLKLFVWDNVLCSYNCGMMFALAHDAHEAREAIIRSNCTGDTADKHIAQYRAWRTDPNRDEYALSTWHDLQTEPRLITEVEGFMCWGSD